MAKQIMLTNAIPAAAQMRAVPNFNPLQFLRKNTSETGETRVSMELRYKRLWFRMACPNGRMLLYPIRVTDQQAVYEARLFLTKEDEQPLVTYTAARNQADTPGGNFVQAAQDDALNTALDNAGFGIQLCEVDPGTEELQSVTTTKTPVPQEQAVNVEAERTAHDESGDKAEAVSPSAYEEPTQDEPPQSAAEKPQEIQTDTEDAQEQEPPAETSNSTKGISNVLSLLHALDGKGGQTPAKQQTAEASRQEGSDQETVLTEPAAAPAAENAAPLKESVPMENSSDAVYEKYANMKAEDICMRMTEAEARNLVIHDGINQGWTMEQVLEQRYSCIEFYAYLDEKCQDIVKAAAMVLLGESVPQQKAS